MRLAYDGLYPSRKNNPGMKIQLSRILTYHFTYVWQVLEFSRMNTSIGYCIWHILPAHGTHVALWCINLWCGVPAVLCPIQLIILPWCGMENGWTNQASLPGLWGSSHWAGGRVRWLDSPRLTLLNMARTGVEHLANKYIILHYTMVMTGHFIRAVIKYQQPTMVYGRRLLLIVDNNTRPLVASSTVRQDGPHPLAMDQTVLLLT